MPSNVPTVGSPRPCPVTAGHAAGSTWERLGQESLLRKGSSQHLLRQGERGPCHPQVNSCCHLLSLAPRYPAGRGGTCAAHSILSRAAAGSANLHTQGKLCGLPPPALGCLWPGDREKGWGGDAVPFPRTFYIRTMGLRMPPTPIKAPDCLAVPRISGWRTGPLLVSALR